MHGETSRPGRRSLIDRRGGAIIVGVVLSVAIGGCGTPVEEPSDVTPATSFGSTIVGVDDDTPAGPVSTAEYTLSFFAATVFCCNPLSIEFVVDTTQMPVGVGILYDWSFGDGRTATGSFVQHSYVAPGEYLVSLIATSEGNALASAERVIVLTGHDVGDVIEVAEEDAPDDPAEDGTPNGDGGGDDTDGEIPPPGNGGTDGDDDPDGGGDAPPDGNGDGGDGSGDSGGDPDGDPAPPTADAGPDQTVEAGTLVQLDGTGSAFPPSEPASYLWSQLSGPAVVLSDAESVTPTFVAPATDGDLVELVFGLTVTAAGQSDLDTATVTVYPEEDPVEEPPPGVTVWFLSGPTPVSEPGPVEVSWVFVGDVVVTGVILRQDCCDCNDIDSAVLFPDFEGVYRATIEVPPDVTIWYHVLYTSAGVVYSSQAVYVNPPAGSPPAEPPAVIWFHSRSFVPEILWEVGRSGVVTHVMISGADRVARAFDAPDVLEVLEICRSTDMKVIWSRYLWNNCGDYQTLEDSWDPEFYASAIAQIQEETAILGADFSAIDCEVYGGSPLDEYFDNDLPPDHFEAMGAAIVEAAEQGQVDFVFPAGWHGRPWQANNLYPPLGRFRISESTYFDLPSKNCRITYPYDVFGAYVQPATTRAESGLSPYFLSYDILERRYLWSAAHGAPGTVNGLFFYPGSDEGAAREVAGMLAYFFDTR